MTIPYTHMTTDELLHEAENSGDVLSHELAKRLEAECREAEKARRAAEDAMVSEDELGEAEHDNEILKARLGGLGMDLERISRHLTTAISKTRL
jgi:hypothetical protein